MLTPFEKNLEVWRQLWRVLERSDIVVQASASMAGYVGRHSLHDQFQAPSPHKPVPAFSGVLHLVDPDWTAAYHSSGDMTYCVKSHSSSSWCDFHGLVCMLTAAL